MNLHIFRDDLKKSGDLTKPPHRISAGALDGNFKKVSPIPQDGEGRGYAVESTDDGWRLIPQSVFTICENGKPVQYRIFAQRITA